MKSPTTVKDRNFVSLPFGTFGNHLCRKPLHLQGGAQQRRYYGVAHLGSWVCNGVSEYAWLPCGAEVIQVCFNLEPVIIAISKTNKNPNSNN